MNIQFGKTYLEIPKSCTDKAEQRHFRDTTPLLELARQNTIEFAQAHTVLKLTEDHFTLTEKSTPQGDQVILSVDSDDNSEAAAMGNIMRLVGEAYGIPMTITTDKPVLDKLIPPEYRNRS